MSLNRHIVTILLAGIILASCSGQATEAPTVDANAIQTVAVETFMASMSQTQAAQVPSATETASPTMTSTPISLVTATPSPTLTKAVLNFVLPTIFKSPTATGTQYTPTVNPASVAVGCNNLRLVLNVTIPAGSVIKPGDKFTKTWKVENNGTCDWKYNYSFVFVGGDRMSGNSFSLGKNIVPGKWTELSVNLKAPSSTGTYTGYWRMADQSGTVFGETLTVSIVVGIPTNTPVPPTATATPKSYP